MQQPRGPLVSVARKGHAGAQLGDDKRDDQLPGPGDQPGPDACRPEIADGEAVVQRDASGDRDHREGHRVQREQPEHAAELLPVAERRKDRLVTTADALVPGHTYPLSWILDPAEVLTVDVRAVCCHLVGESEDAPPMAQLEDGGLQRGVAAVADRSEGTP